MSGSLRHAAAAGVRWTTLATAVVLALQLVQIAVLARILPPEDFGLMAMLTEARALRDEPIPPDRLRRDRPLLRWLSLRSRSTHAP